MSTRLHSVRFKAASLLHLAACVVSMLMLLAFPMQRGHRYTSHFRTPEVRRSIERHTPIAHSEAGTAERIAYQAVMPVVLEPLQTGDALKPVVNFALFPQIPIS